MKTLTKLQKEWILVGTIWIVALILAIIFGC